MNKDKPPYKSADEALAEGEWPGDGEGDGKQSYIKEVRDIDGSLKFGNSLLEFLEDTKSPLTKGFFTIDELDEAIRAEGKSAVLPRKMLPKALTNLQERDMLGYDSKDSKYYLKAS
jgi:hypothetical protein